MLPFVRLGTTGPLVVLLHWLGGSAHTWDAVTKRLSNRGFQIAAMNLPGFGEASSHAQYDVHSMAEQVIEAVRDLQQETGANGTPWLLAGHSMGGKVASVVARRALDGDPGLEGLRGLIYVSASPPGPEPMSDKKRSQMLDDLGASTGDEAKDRKLAQRFVEDNVGKVPLPEPVLTAATETVLSMNRTAFRAWLLHGSNEDWTDRVGTLPLPALVLAGSEDAALGPDAQREHLLPHLPQAQMETLQGGGHLAPLERPGEVVEYMTQFAAGLGLPLQCAVPAPSSELERLLGSEHTAPQTREVLETRQARTSTWNNEPKAFTAAEQRLLRSLVEAIVPDAGFDVAAMLDDEVATKQGDGWRFAVLPADGEAWHKGMQSLDLAAERAHGVNFAGLPETLQCDLLRDAGEGKLGPGLLGNLRLGASSEAFSAEQMRFWFEDVRAACTRYYVADPRTMQRIGFTGFADDLGFTQIRLGETEEFER